MMHDQGENISTWEIGHRPPSIAAIEGVAAHRGTDPTEMADRLHEYVDPDALDTLLKNSSDDHVCIEFQMGNEIVELRNDGALDVRTADD